MSLDILYLPSPKRALFRRLQSNLYVQMATLRVAQIREY